MPDIGFFAFNSKNGECACYFTALECPDDDLFNDYNAYNIIEGNISILKVQFLNFYPTMLVLNQ